ncbi:MAG: hypothetical protein COB85_06575 [Bacteroidetes bacterium]|nr:MAG: hypothetical protein COB85_06575 [Bacteroidota bacterium]
MNKLKSIFFLSAILLSFGVLAQQVPLGNQYLLNDFSLSPAYAGSNGNVESILSYRKDWAGVAGSPESRMININGALPNILSFLPKVPSNMGLGATILSEQSGMFRSTSFSIAYAYKLKIAAIQSLRLGVSLGLVESNVDMSKISTQQSSDPVLMNAADVRRTVFDASFGVLYQFQNLDFGVAIPRLIESQVKDDNSNSVYTLSRHYIIHASYYYNINKDFQVKPYIIARTTGNSPLLFEVMAQVKYQKKYWVGLLYRKTSMGMSLGGEFFNMIALNYSYEFSGQGLMSESGGTHEITLGFKIGKKDEDVPAASPAKPYYDWIKK